MTTPYIDPNLIFAENAPVQDKPAAFANYDKGWDESRNNDGRPLIPQMNYLTQQADLKNLYIHKNGAALPYKDGIAYEENAVVVKDGVLQQWKGGEWANVSANKASDILDASGKTQQEINDSFRSKVNPYSITPEMFGAVGDGVADDTTAFQSAVTFASTQKAKIVLNGKYRLTSKVSAYTLYGFTSESCGTIIIDHVDDAFSFVGASPNTWIERFDFEYKQATTVGKATFLFEYPYLIMGLKIDRLNLNGFSGCNWTFLKLKGSNGAGFFGGFLYSNVRSYHIYADIDYDETPWSNSSTFFNNFKFYGTYGLLIRDNGKLIDANITGWWGQEVSGGVIHCLNGVLEKCDITSVLNWDTNVPAIHLGKNTLSNTVKKVYVFDIVDNGYCNEIHTSDNLYVSNAVTAISSSFFEQKAFSTKGSFACLFKETLAGNAKTASGITSQQGSGLNVPAYWLQTKPATTSPVTDAGSILLDTVTDQLDGVAMVAAFDRYAGLRVFYDFYLTQTVFDDKAFLIGVGVSASAATPISGFFITVISNRLKVVYAAFDGAVTEIVDLGVVTTDRHQIQFTIAAYQSSGFSGVFHNGKFKANLTPDVSLSRRPVVKVASATNANLLGLISANFRSRQSAQMK